MGGSFFLTGFEILFPGPSPSWAGQMKRTMESNIPSPSDNETLSRRQHCFRDFVDFLVKQGAKVPMSRHYREEVETFLREN